MHFAAKILRVRAGHGIARHGHQRHVARIDERGRQHGQGRLRADAVIHLGGRIKLDAETPLHQSGRGLLKLANAIVGVATVGRLIDLATHRGADRLRRKLVIFADAEVDQLALGMLGHGLALGPLDLLELIDLGPFAVIDTANAFGKEILKVRIAHKSAVTRKCAVDR